MILVNTFLGKDRKKGKKIYMVSPVMVAHYIVLGC
jgi:hypothetical protein